MFGFHHVEIKNKKDCKNGKNDIMTSPVNAAKVVSKIRS